MAGFAASFLAVVFLVAALESHLALAGWTLVSDLCSSLSIPSIIEIEADLALFFHFGFVVFLTSSFGFVYLVALVAALVAGLAAGLLTFLASSFGLAAGFLTFFSVDLELARGVLPFALLGSDFEDAQVGLGFVVAAHFTDAHHGLVSFFSSAGLVDFLGCVSFLGCDLEALTFGSSFYLVTFGFAACFFSSLGFDA